MHGNEPILTWNLFLTAILVPVGLYILGVVLKNIINRSFSQFYKGWEKYEEEREKNIKEKQEDYRMWREKVSKSLTLLTTKLPDLITSDECSDMHSEIYTKLNDHGERIVALETRCSFNGKK